MRRTCPDWIRIAIHGVCMTMPSFVTSLATTTKFAGKHTAHTNHKSAPELLTVAFASSSLFFSHRSPRCQQHPLKPWNDQTVLVIILAAEFQARAEAQRSCWHWQLYCLAARLARYKTLVDATSL